MKEKKDKKNGKPYLAEKLKMTHVMTNAFIYRYGQLIWYLVLNWFIRLHSLQLDSNFLIYIPHQSAEYDFNK